MAQHPVIHYRSHVIRERYIEDGIRVYTVDDHGHGTISSGFGSPAGARNDIDFCISQQRACFSRLMAMEPSA